MVEYHSEEKQQPKFGWPWTWRSLREWMEWKHAATYRPQELRQMELKWRKIFSEAGFSIKGE